MQARFFDDTKNVCMLCPRHCSIPNGARGFCRVRENRNGTLITRTYGELTACGIDPIEKKPLNHFLPGSATLSISSFGCNFTCKHCQNHTLSQDISCTTEYAEPEDIVRIARQNQVDSISFTYNEPTVFYEYMYDVAKLAHASGLKTAIITNGYLNEDPCKELARYMDAFRIDLKAFSDTFYRTVCGNAHLQPILDTISRVAKLKRHLELVTLIIPGLNDSPDELAGMLSWERETLGPSIPHHFTAFSPNYQMTTIPAADHGLMDRVFRQAKDAGLYYPYVGNVIHNEGSTTYCPSCGSKLIQRIGYVSRMPGINQGYCKHCGRKIEGIF
ncbi:MAG TPA: AmmeMemoRadiSam system radical SAM enzyme [Methanocorpusculum sp.]|nr:AmmeMemoRadiSam system radical SAM enzyme [Methanocorpusculum sp.]